MSRSFLKLKLFCLIFGTLLITLVLMSSSKNILDIPFQLVPTITDSQIKKHAIRFKYDNKSHHVDLIESASGVPLYYASEVVTPICEDSICEIVNIRIFWDLSGSYFCYDTIPGYPLTKKNHIPFNNEDYSKLHVLLKDKSSIIKDKDYHDLVINETQYTTSGIDAVSGATSIEVKNAVVNGAVYSSYSLWHLVNGVSAELIKEHTISIANKKNIESLLKSKNDNHVLMGIKLLDKTEFNNYKSLILSILNRDAPIIHGFLFESIPENFLENNLNQVEITKNFKFYTADNKDLFIKRLQSCDNIISETLILLSENISIMSYIQVKNFVSILNNNSGIINNRVRENIKNAMNQKNFKYTYLLKSHL